MNHVFSPSYKRATIACVHKVMPFVTYVVSEDEADEYRKIHDKVWSVPRTAQGSLEKIRNYILDNVESEHVLLVDDDITAIKSFDGTKSRARKLSADEIVHLIAKAEIMCEDMGIKFWGLNIVADTGAYREYTPFGLAQYIGGPWQGHYKNDLRYDERMTLKEDHDMTLQVLNKYRMNLRLNMYHYVCDQHGKPGGCATYRTIEREKQQNNALRKKWGSKIVRFDTGASKVNRKKEIAYDINPIIKIPIKGV